MQGVSHRHPGCDHDTPARVSFRLGPGERGLLVGPVGSGKSTLLQRVVGLTEGPGRLLVGDLPVERRDLREVRRRTGFLWQDPDDALLLPTVIEDVALGPANDGREREALELARGWLERLDIAHLAPRRVRTLSQGEKQLVALAGVLAREPGLLLLDEPAAALDGASRERLAAALDGLPATLLMATHEPDFWLQSGGRWNIAASLPGHALPA